MNKLIKEFQVDLLQVKIYDDEEAMGIADAKLIAQKIKDLLKIQDEVNIVFAPAVSQLAVYKHLFTDKDIDWSKVNGFHLDEYIGMEEDDERKITNFAYRNIFSKATFKNIFLLNSLAEDHEKECARYEKLLKRHPLDIAVVGIGTNGHVAYNEPSVADFNDHKVMKIVDIDEISIKQAAVYDNIFAKEGDVITKAYTMTMPTIMAAKHLFFAVPNPHKAQAVFDTLRKEISTACPASIIRKHPSAVLLIDKQASKLL